MSAVLLAGLSVPGVLLLSAVSWPLVKRWEARRAVEAPNPLQVWRSLPTEVQAARDLAVLDAQEAAELAAGRPTIPTQRNPLHRP